MKTFIEVDGSGNYKDKMAELQACLFDGTTLGSCDFNLANFAKPDKYLKNMILTKTAPGVSKQSFIIVEIKTQDATKPASSSSKIGSGSSTAASSFAPNSQSSKQLKLLETQLNKLKETVNTKSDENSKIITELEKMGVKAELSKAQTTKMVKDNTEKYQKIVGIEDADIKQLLKLDKDIERMFEVQMRKRNKNDEMVRNKINELNEKPALRDFLFKQVSDQQLKKDIEDMEVEIEKMYTMM